MIVFCAGLVFQPPPPRREKTGFCNGELASLEFTAIGESETRDFLCVLLASISYTAPRQRVKFVENGIRAL